MLPDRLAGRAPEPGWLDEVVARGRSRRPARAPPVRALGRPAAAGRRGPGAGGPPRDRVRRRADRQPRLAQRRRDPRLPAPRRRRDGPDRRDGHPRPAGGGQRRQRAVPGRRADRRPPGRPDAGRHPRPHVVARRRGPPARGSTSPTSRSMPTEADRCCPSPCASCGPTPAGSPARRSPCCSASRSSPARWCSATRCAANFDTLFAEVNAGTDVVVRDVDRPRAGRRPTGASPASLVDDVAGVDGVAAAAPGRDRLRPAARRRRRRHRRQRPAHARRQLDHRPRAQPVPPGRGPRPRGRRRGRDRTGARPTTGDLAVGDTTTVLTPEPVEVTIVGIATFGDEDGLGGVTFTAFTLDDAMAHIAKAPDEVTSISVRGDGEVVAGRAGRARRRGAARRRRGDRPGPSVTHRDDRRHQRGVPRHADDVPHRVRRHRPARRHVQHLQHVLDHRRPAQPRGRAAAGARRRRSPGAAGRARRGARSSA